MEICTNLIKLSILHNKRGFMVTKNKKNLSILISYLKINIIKSIKIWNNKKLIILINYIDGKPIFKNIVNMYKKRNKKLISLSTLNNLKKKYNWIFLISTNIGILNNHEALIKRVGGVILCKIWN